MVGMTRVTWFERDLWGNEITRYAWVPTAEISGPPHCHECDKELDDGETTLCDECRDDPESDEKPSDGWHEQNERHDP